MYEIKVNIDKLKEILNRRELVEIITARNPKPEKISCSIEKLLSTALEIEESDLYLDLQRKTFTLIFKGTESKAEEYFCQELLKFTQTGTKEPSIRRTIEKISNIINLERVDVDTFSCYLSSAYFSKEAKEVIYEYYTEALKKVKLPLNTVGLEELWQEYRNVLEFLSDFGEYLDTDELSFTPELLEEISDKIPQLSFWVTKTENTLVVKYF